LKERGGRPDRGYVRVFTARAITKPRMASEALDSSAIVSFAQWASGITSVGLKAMALVKPR
jgi:hypothetical protein